MNKNLAELIESVIVPLGYEVIDVEFAADGIMRVFIDVLHGSREITIKDCESVSKQLVYFLPVEKVSYERLEVSSPGVNRRLTKDHHFARFVGSKIKVRFKCAVAGRKSFEGVLLYFDSREEKNNGLREIDPENKDFGKYCIEYADSGGNKSSFNFKLNELDDAHLIADLRF